jgi:membrane protease subunit HflC
MRYATAAVLVLALSAGLVWMSTYAVSEREYAVLTQFGKPTRTVDEAGLYFKRPGFLETVNRVERRTHVFNTQPIQLLLGDQNPIVLTCYVCWRVREPLLFFQSVVTVDIAAQKLGDMVNSQLGNTLGDYRLANIINTTSDQVKIVEIEEKILASTNAKTREKYGIEVVQVGIRRLAYPSIVAEAVYNRMRSEREKEARKYRAEGKEEATMIKARADREVQEILAESYKQAEIRKGEGDQQALKIYAEAYAKDAQFFEFMRSMEVYQSILGENSTLVLSTDSELFRYLNHPAGKE